MLCVFRYGLWMKEVIDEVLDDKREWDCKLKKSLICWCMFLVMWWGGWWRVWGVVCESVWGDGRDFISGGWGVSGYYDELRILRNL